MSASASNPLSVLSHHLAEAVAQTAKSVVAVLGRGRHSSSGFAWRAGTVVTASDALEHDDDIHILLPDGQRVVATLAGRDPSTDIAVLRVGEANVPPITPPVSREVRAGEIALSVGRHRDGPVARLGIVAVAGGPWHSMRGGRIDRNIRLDRVIHAREEGGVLMSADAEWIGMTVAGPHGAALAIPSETIARVAERLLAHGRIARGYLGLGLQPVRLDEALVQSLSLKQTRGAIVISVDPNGPGRGAGFLIGDVILSWNSDPVHGVRDVFRRLGADEVGQEIELAFVRGGEARTVKLKVGERPPS